MKDNENGYGDPTEKDMFFKEWGYERFKENIPIINDVFKIFIAVDAGLLSIHSSLLDAHHLSPNMEIAIFSTLLASLGCSMYGIFPKRENINVDEVGAFEGYISRLTRNKKIALWLSLIFMVATFLLFFYANTHMPPIVH